MKRSNILLVVALAVIVLLIGPLSAMAIPVTTLSNISKTLTQTSPYTCVSGGSACNGHAFGSDASFTKAITWNVNSGSVSNVPLFTITWNSATGHGYELRSTIDFLFHFTNPTDVITITGTVDEKIVLSTNTALNSLTYTFNAPESAEIGGKFITVSLNPGPVLTPGLPETFYGSIAVPEPSLAMLLPLGLVFVGGLRKRFLP